MVDQIAVVKTSKAAGVGTLDVTSPAITEAFSAAIIIATRNSGGAGDDTNMSHGVMGVGFIGVNGTTASNTFQCCMSNSFSDGKSTATTARQVTGRNLNQAIRLGDGSGTVIDIVAVYNASITGGVQLNFTTCNVQCDLTVVLFAGLSKACTGDCTFNDTAGSHENVGPGGSEFQPDLLIFLPSENTTNADSANCSTIALGFALNKVGIPQVASYLNGDNQSNPTDADGYYRSDVCSAAFIGSGRADQDRFQVTSFDATGFNGIAIDTGGLNSPQANYLALKFSGAFRMACAQLSVAASTGQQAFNSFGFTPDLVFGMVHLLTTPDTITDGANASTGGYFITGRYGSRALAASDQEGLTVTVNPTVAKTRQGDHAVLCMTHAAAVALQAEWLGGSGSGGFLLNFTTASQAGTLTALGIQLIPSSPVVHPQTDAASQGRRRAHAKRLASTHAASAVVVHGQAEAASRQRGRAHAKRVAATKSHAIIGRVLKEVGRFRRAALARMRFRPVAEGLFTLPPPGVAIEEHSIGVVVRPGMIRGAVVGPGVEREDEIL